MSDDRAWHIVRTVELGAATETVWEVVRGFFNIPQWHSGGFRTQTSYRKKGTDHGKKKITTLQHVRLRRTTAGAHSRIAQL
ncbi:MAG: hypothetical protein MI923_02985 [Phycisphaerales bacterium]|nr:hypothetical protein [Phycisphaerales bacterium]